MCLFDQLCQMLVPDDLVILESAEDGVVGAEAVEAAAKNPFIQKLVLAKKSSGLFVMGVPVRIRL